MSEEKMECTGCGQLTEKNRYASWQMYCPECAFNEGNLCSGCHMDGGNGAASGTSCCSETTMGAIGSGAQEECEKPPWKT